MYSKYIASGLKCINYASSYLAIVATYTQLATTIYTVSSYTMGRFESILSVNYNILQVFLWLI